MTRLYVNEILLGDDGFLALASCIKNIEELRIVETAIDEKLTFKGFQALAKDISKRDRPVRPRRLLYKIQ